jgi:hypothetical protein
MWTFGFAAAKTAVAKPQTELWLCCKNKEKIFEPCANCLYMFGCHVIMLTPKCSHTIRYMVYGNLAHWLPVVLFVASSAVHDGGNTVIVF